MKLQGKTVLITGGTSGIGLEMARQLVERGNAVAVTGRDPRKLEQARRALPGLKVFESDVSDPAAITSLYRRVLAELPTLDVLVNNAGIMRNLDLIQPRELTDVTRELDVLLRGPIQMTQQFLPLLRTRGEALIVNVSSGIAFIPFAISPVYSAAKAGLHAFSQCLRVQLDGTGVRVVELAPPGTETPLFRAEFAEEMKGRTGMNVKVLVENTLIGIERGRSEVTPGLANVLKAMSRVAPHFMFNQLAKVGRPTDAGRAFRESEAQFVVSQDGTRIGYHQVGRGPGLLLVQGAMGTSLNFAELARALADSFTVYIPDRRGRGLSALPFSEGYSVERDVQDVRILLRETGARFVFGLSSGALITLAALRVLPEIQKAVLYEPPLFLGPAPSEAIARFNREVKGNQLGAAIVTMMSIVGLAPGLLGAYPVPFFAWPRIPPSSSTDGDKGAGGTRP